MNTVADTSVPGLAPEVPIQPAAAVLAVVVVPNVRKSTMRGVPELAPELPVQPTVVAPNVGRVKDTLVAIYAYGLLAFGLLFPLLLAAWAAIFEPAAQ